MRVQNLKNLGDLFSELREFLNYQSRRPFLVVKEEWCHLNFGLLVQTVWSTAQIMLQYPQENVLPKFFPHIKWYKGKFPEPYDAELKLLMGKLKSSAELSHWKRDTRVQEILKKREVFLSDFSFEVFQTVLVSGRFKWISKLIFRQDCVVVRRVSSKKQESFLGRPATFDHQKSEKVLQVNKAHYVPGMSRDFFNFVSKLDDIAFKAGLHKGKDPREIAHEEKDKIGPKHRFPIEKSSDTFLSGCPEYKNKFCVDFAKAYIRRKRVGPDDDPNIVRIDLLDPDFSISVVEFNSLMKVLILGFTSGMIRVILLYKVILNI